MSNNLSISSSFSTGYSGHYSPKSPQKKVTTAEVVPLPSSPDGPKSPREKQLEKENKALKAEVVKLTKQMADMHARLNKTISLSRKSPRKKDVSEFEFKISTIFQEQSSIDANDFNEFIFAFAKKQGWKEIPRIACKAGSPKITFYCYELAKRFDQESDKVQAMRSWYSQILKDFIVEIQKKDRLFGGKPLSSDSGLKISIHFHDGKSQTAISSGFPRFPYEVNQQSSERRPVVDFSPFVYFLYRGEVLLHATRYAECLDPGVICLFKQDAKNETF